MEAVLLVVLLYRKPEWKSGKDGQQECYLPLGCEQYQHYNYPWQLKK